MSFAAVADIAAVVCLLTGSLLALAGAVGLLRFPDLLTRMHAATKPQTLGLLLILLGVGLRLRDPSTIGILILVAVIQGFTTPVAAHMVGRAAYRTGHVRADLLVTDELADALDRADREERGDRTS